MAIFQTPPLPITDLPADADHKSAGRLGYRWIVLHHTGGTDSRAWLSTTSSPRVSVQRLITKTGENIKIVQDGDTAYTQGPARVGKLPRRDPHTNAIVETVNEWALAIEFENLGNGRDPYPDVQMRSGALQIVEWWGAHGFLALVGHGWIQANKNDPLGFPWDAFYARCWEQLREVARQ